MQLLVSVANAREAKAALDGGADLIDAKDPWSGALGAVSLDTLQDIHAVVRGARPVTAALGDAFDETMVERAAFEYAAAGAAFVKIGFASIASASHATQLTSAAVRGARGAEGSCGVVAVAYADTGGLTSLAPGALIDTAARAGAMGVLLDTADKSGPGLRQLMTARDLGAWVAGAHNARLIVALAGKLATSDLALVRDAGADIAGVRGAACDGGRTGNITADKVRLLRGMVGRAKALGDGLAQR